MPITAERLEVDVQANTAGAKRDIDRFDSSVQNTARSSGKASGAATRMGGAFKASALLAVGAAGTMAVALGGKTIMAASDLNEQVSKTGVVFGPQAKLVTDAAQQMADKFGMSKTVFLEAASGIGLVGKASGLSKKGAAGLSTEMARLAADASSFYNVPVTEALDAMKSGLVGEAEPMRRFGVLLSDAAVQTESARLGLSKMGDELTEGQKVQARASLITKGMTDANGDLERTQSSVSNRLREVQGRVTNWAAAMGTKALPAVSKFLGGLIKAPGVVRAAFDWVQGFAASFAAPFQAALAPLAPLFGLAATGAARLGTVLAGIGSFIASHSTAFGTAAAVITAVFIPAMVRAAVVATVTKVKVVAAFVAKGLAAVRSAALVGVSAIKVVAAWTMMAARSLAQAARMAASWVIAMGPVGWAIAAAVAVGVAIYKNWDKVKAVTVRAWSAVSNAVTNAWSSIKGAVTGGGSAVTGAVSGAWGRVKGATSSAWNAVKSMVSRAWNAMTNAVKNGVGDVVRFHMELPQRILSALGNLGSLLVNAGSDVIEGFLNGLKAKWEDVKGFLASATDMIPNLKGPRAKDRKLLIDNGKAVMEGFKEGLNREWSEVKRFLKAATKWVENSAMPEKAGKALESRLERVGKRVKTLLTRNAALAEKMTVAVQAHADAVQAKADFQSSTFSGMNAQANVMNAGNNGATIADSLRAQVAKVAKFAQDVAALATRGLNRDAIAQITAAGVDGGSQVAQALAAATDQELASINQSYAAIGTTATNTARDLAGQLHDAGIGAAQAVVDGLQTRMDKIKSTLRTIAQTMVDEVGAIVRQAIQKEKAAAKAQEAKEAAAAKAQMATQGGPQGPREGPRPPRGPQSPRATGGGPQAKATTFNFTTHNPQREPQSRTTNKALARAASLGLV